MPPKKRPPPTAALAAVKKKQEAAKLARAELLLAHAAAENSVDAPHAVAEAPQPVVEPPMSAEQIAAALQAEDLQLLPSARAGSTTGYLGVYPTGNGQRPYVAQIRRNGRNVVLGKFATAAEAALAYARELGPAATRAAAAAAPSRPLTASEALSAAAAEGLQLQRSAQTESGFKGVSKGSGERKRPYNVCVRGDTLGSFETPEEAALVYARATRPLLRLGHSGVTLADLAGAARAVSSVCPENE